MTEWSEGTPSIGGPPWWAGEHRRYGGPPLVG
jgi:hypothetical protein